MALRALFSSWNSFTTSLSRGGGLKGGCHEVSSLKAVLIVQKRLPKCAPSMSWEGGEAYLVKSWKISLESEGEVFMGEPAGGREGERQGGREVGMEGGRARGREGHLFIGDDVPIECPQAVDGVHYKVSVVAVVCERVVEEREPREPRHDRESCYGGELAQLVAMKV